MSQISFGTDGWRAVIAEDFTFANLDRVAQATATFWATNRQTKGEAKAVVGYDRRFLSDQFAHRTAEILAGNGFKVALTPAPTPTPAVSFAVSSLGAEGGVMITASHNPPRFNGFKLKAHYGGSADPATCKAIESLLDSSPVKAVPFDEGRKSGSIHGFDACKPHFNAIKRLVDFRLIARSKLKFAHEALFGVGAGCFATLLRNTTCQVTTLNAAHDPFFGGINPEPVPQNYVKSAAYLRRHPHDLCLVTDGDADRVGGMDGRGNPLSTHQLICLLLWHLRENKKLTGKVVKALTTTSMVDKMCDDYGLSCVETGVGFKYICSEMLKGDVLLGAEESGGIGFPGHIPERDGILAGLMLLELLAVSNRPLRKLLEMLEKRYGPHHYARIDTHFPLEKRAALMEYCKTHPPTKLAGSKLKDLKSFDGVKFIAENGAWLMIRGSGTEPILRIYAEATSKAEASKLLALGKKMTTQI